MQLRRSIGFVFQEGALISNFTAYDNIALPLRTRGGMVEEELRTRVRSLMEEFGLFNVEAKYPEALSEWQTKAVAAARALAGDPDMLLLDEPVSGLDPVTAGGILNAVERRWKTTGLAVVMISHDLSMWPHIAANRLSLESGKLYPYREGACHEGPMEQRA
jgi:phospholipid/cholesterol/gamma-HCH transport system ATP-binding protein